MTRHDMDGSYTPNLRKYDRIGRAIIIEIHKEPRNIGLATIEDTRTDKTHVVPIWLLEMARSG